MTQSTTGPNARKQQPPRVHLTWSVEHPMGTCQHCNGKTVLAIAPSAWDVDSESAQADGFDENEFVDGVETDAEVTGHWCPGCRSLVSVSVNQPG